jgi:hypothetical protein
MRAYTYAELGKCSICRNEIMALWRKNCACVYASMHLFTHKHKNDLSCVQLTYRDHSFENVRLHESLYMKYLVRNHGAFAKICVLQRLEHLRTLIQRAEYGLLDGDAHGHVHAERQLR